MVLGIVARPDLAKKMFRKPRVDRPKISLFWADTFAETDWDLVEYRPLRDVVHDFRWEPFGELVIVYHNGEERAIEPKWGGWEYKGSIGTLKQAIHVAGVEAGALRP